MDIEPPAGLSTHAIYFDGRSNRRRQVALNCANALDIYENGAFVAAWSFADIRRVDGQGDLLRIRCISAPKDARCEIRDTAFAAALESRCGLLHGDAQEARDGTARIVGWSLGAAVSLAAIVWFGVPLLAERLTPLVPHSIERRLGDVAERQVRAMFDGHACVEPKGQAALAKLAQAMIRASGAPDDTKVDTLSSPVTNAFALPGGRVFVLRGLIDKAQSSDEVAGVIAHELGHVAHRDGLRVAISHGSAAFVLGLFFGDVFGAGAVLAGARAALGAAYTREAETQADDYAARAMRAAGRSARPLGEFLKRTAQGEARTPLDFLRDHPSSDDRLARIAREPGDTTAPPLLTDEEWEALKGVCSASK